MTILKRTAVVCIAVLLELQCVFATGAVEKEETVYVNLNYDGTVIEANVINSFKMNGNTTVLDYGNYSTIKNLSSTDEPVVKNGTIEFKTNEENFYYQGKMRGCELPWNFNISYTLNNRNIKGAKLAGKSGNIGIKIKADVNEKANDYYKDNYLAQISVTFDTDKCKNIVSDDAMVSNVGSSKTLTFMVLPDLSRTYDITLNAKNFEFDGVTIGLVKVSDGIMSSIDTVKSSISNVSGSISSLVSGTGELKGGAADLYSGLNLLNTATGSLTQAGPAFSSGFDEIGGGIDSLDSGVSRLTAGSSQVRDGLKELDNNSQNILDGISSIDNGLDKMAKSKPTIKSGLVELANSKSKINELKSGASTLKSGYKQIENGLHTMAGNASAVSDGQKAISGNAANITYLSSSGNSLAGKISMVLSSMTDEQKKQMPQVVALLQASQSYAQQSAAAIGQVYSAANAMSGAALKLAEGSQSLYTNIQTLNNGMSTLSDGIDSADLIYNAAETFGNSALALAEGAEKAKGGCNELYSGFKTYSDGVGTLAENYTDIDNGLYDVLGGVSTLKGGFTTMRMSADTLFSSTDELADSVGTLLRGSQLLYGGTETLDNSVENAAGTLGGKDISSLISMSEGAEVVSFAAPGAIQPKSVQFVIKSPSIKTDDAADDVQDKESTGFFAKLISLFSFKTGVVNGIMGILLAVFLAAVIVTSVLRNKKAKKANNDK